MKPARPLLALLLVASLLLAAAVSSGTDGRETTGVTQIRLAQLEMR